MISYIQIKNFRSIADAIVDLRYGEGKAPNGYQKSPRLAFLKEEGCDERTVPCLALFGSNANGKSNLLRAISILRTAIFDSRIGLVDSSDHNLIVTCDEPTAIILGFIKDSAQYEYQLAYSTDQIEYECLSREGKILFKIDANGYDFKNIAIKKPYTPSALEEIFKVECCDGMARWMRPLLNVLGHRYAGLNPYVTAAFELIAKDIHVFLDGGKSLMLPQAVNQLSTVMQCEQKAALDEIVEVIRKLDVEIRGIEIVNQKTNQEMHSFIRSFHKNDRNENVVFDFLAQESEGTIRLASLVAYLLSALYSGATIFVDELDRSLHPLLVRAALSLFQQRARNTKNAQIVFTTHCTDLLDDEILRLSEIGIVTKNAALGTKVKRLCDLRRDGEDIRNVTNFRRMYLDGFYSGVPYPAM